MQKGVGETAARDKNMHFIKMYSELVVQSLRVWASTVGSVDSIPGLTKIPHAAQPESKK